MDLEGGCCALTAAKARSKPAGERFVLVVPASHGLAKRKKVHLSEVSGQNFVMYERAHSPGLHDLILGILRDAGIVQ